GVKVLVTVGVVVRVGVGLAVGVLLGVGVGETSGVLLGVGVMVGGWLAWTVTVCGLPAAPGAVTLRVALFANPAGMAATLIPTFTSASPFPLVPLNVTQGALG